MLIPHLLAASSVPAWSWGQEAGSISGLWRLAGVMPAGMPSREIPEGFEAQLYWFQHNGTVSFIVESSERRSQITGKWKQSGNNVTIAWENGGRNEIKVVTLGENHMILTGLGARPLWFRFLRYF